MEKSGVFVINVILYRKDKYEVKTSEAVYEFVDKVAYFACAANIIIENYTASDGADFYRELMGNFREFMQLYQRLTKAVEQDQLTDQKADIILKSMLNWLHQNSMRRFAKAMSKALQDNNFAKTLEYDIETCFFELSKKRERTGFRARDLLEILKEIRILEEVGSREIKKMKQEGAGICS